MRDKEILLDELCEKLSWKSGNFTIGQFKIEFSKYIHEGTGNQIERHIIFYNGLKVGAICIEDKGDLFFHIFDFNVYTGYPYEWGSLKLPKNTDILLELNKLL